MKFSIDKCVNLLVVILAFCFAGVQGQAVERYEYKNIRIGGGGFVTGIIFSKATAGIVYARTDQGGAYRFDKATGTWVQMLNFLGHSDFQLSNVEGIAADPTDASRVYLACGQEIYNGAQRAIFRSTDGGLSFEKIIPPFEMGGNYPGRGNGERLQVDPNKNNILFMATRTKGLFKTTDYGTTWQSIGSFPVTTTANNTGINAIEIDKGSASTGNPSQVMYVSVSRTSNNIYKTTDGGTTWTLLAGQPVGYMPHRMRLTAEGILYVTYSTTEGPGGSTSGNVWKFNSITGKWTDITPVSGAAFGGISPDPSAPGVVMVSTHGWFPDKIYRSTNGGTTWKDVSTVGINNVTRNTDEFPWTQWHNTTADAGHWVDDVQIDPFNSARVMYVTGGGIWASDNITNSEANNTVVWDPRNRGIEQMGGWGTGKNMVSPPTGPLVYTVLGDIGGFRHETLDASPPAANFFSPIGNSNTSIDIAWLKPSFLVRTHYDGTRGSYSSNEGLTWTNFPTSPAAATTNAANDPGYMAVSANGNSIVWQPKGPGIYYSANKGTSWSLTTGGPTATQDWNRFVPVSDKVNDLKFYLQDGRDGKIYRSTNGGLTWVSVATLPPPSDAAGFTMQSVPGMEGHVWLPEGTAGFHRSIDGGSSWTKLTNVQACEQVGFGKPALGKTYPSIFIYASITNQWGFYRSDDEGTSWIRINDDHHNFNWISGICGDPKIVGRIYIMTTGRGVLYGDPKQDACSATTVIQKLSVNGAAATVASSVKVSLADTITFLPTTGEQGSWYWSGPQSFGGTIQQNTRSNIQANQGGEYNVTFINACGATTSLTYSVSLDIVCDATTIAPYMQVNSGLWSQDLSASVNIGDKISFGPQPFGGIWTWLGPNDFTATGREVSFTINKQDQGGYYIGTFQNDCGAKSTVTYTLTVNPACAGTAIIPFIKINAGTEQQTNTVTVNNGNKITLSPQPLTGGTWLWSGPEGYASLQREVVVTNIQAINSGTYTATYTNACAGESTLDFELIVNVVTQAEEEVVNSRGAVIFPNPSQGNFVIRIAAYEKDMVYSLYSMLGAKVSGGKIMGNETHVQEPGREGLYILKIHSSKNTITTKVILN